MSSTGHVRRLLTIAVALSGLFIVSRGWGEESPEDDGPVVVVVAEGTSLDPSRVREVIAQELGVPAIDLTADEARRARGMLTITQASSQALLFFYRHRSGVEVWRVMNIREQPDENLRSIALLAGNLARDQTSQLIGNLNVVEPEIEETPPPPPPEPAPEPQPCPEPPEVDCHRAERAARVDDARDRAFSDPWAIEANLGGVFAQSSLGPRVTARLAYRWGAFALSLSENSGWISQCTWAECAILGQHSLALEATYRLRIGPLIAEFGIGAGARLHRFNSQRGSIITYSPVGRLQLAVVIPIVRGVDLVVSNEVATTFFSVQIPAFYSDLSLSLWEIGVSFGVRVHLPGRRRG